MTTSDPKCEHGISLSDLCEYASHRANDPTPGDHDELLAEVESDGYVDTGSLVHRLAAALRTEQSARQALQQRIDAALAILSWMPDHDGDDKNRVEQDYMYRAQLADEAYTALSESQEPDHEQ